MSLPVLVAQQEDVLFFCAVILVPRVTCIELIYSWMVSFSNSHYTEQSAFTSEGHVKA